MRVLFTFIIFSSFLIFLNAQTQTFTSSGSFTVPAGVTEIFVRVFWGSGGMQEVALENRATIAQL